MSKKITNQRTLNAFIQQENIELRSPTFLYKDNALTYAQYFTFSHRYFEDIYAIRVDDTIYINENIRIKTPAFGGFDSAAYLRYTAASKNYIIKYFPTFQGVFKYKDIEKGDATLILDTERGYTYMLSAIEAEYYKLKVQYINSRIDNPSKYQPIYKFIRFVHDCKEVFNNISKDAMEKVRLGDVFFKEFLYVLDNFTQSSIDYLMSEWIRPWDLNREKRETNRAIRLEKEKDAFFIENRRQKEEKRVNNILNDFYNKTYLYKKDVLTKLKCIDFIPIRLLDDIAWQNANAIQKENIVYNYDYLRHNTHLYSIPPWGICESEVVSYNTLMFLIQFIIIRIFMYIRKTHEGHFNNTYADYIENKDSIDFVLNHKQKFKVTVFIPSNLYHIGCKTIYKKTIDMLLNKYFDLNLLLPVLIEYLKNKDYQDCIDDYRKELEKADTVLNKKRYDTQINNAKSLLIEWITAYSKDSNFINDIKSTETVLKIPIKSID